MNISGFELVNALIAAGLIGAVWRERKLSIIFVLFLYGTLHFAYSTFALFSHDSTQLLIDMHTNGAGILALSSGILVLMSSYALLAGRVYRASSKIRLPYKHGVFWVLVVAIFCLLVGYCLNYRVGDRGQALNVASVAAIFMLLLLIQLKDSALEISIDKHGLLLFGILLLVVGVAVYEVAANKAWSVFWKSDGVMVYRASSFLFNPNLLAYWASLIYIAAVYAWHARPDKNRLWCLAMVLLAATIYMSGSRSGLALLFAALMFSAIIVRGKISIYAPIILTITVSAIYGVALGLSSTQPWGKFAVLGERYQMAFFHLYGYLASFVGSKVQVPPEVETSIEGRFVGDTLDAGWLVLHQDAGWLGIFALFGVIAFLIMRLLRLGEPGSGYVRAYVLAALFYCVASGLVMRFQIFPVWLFFGVVMAVAVNVLRLSQKIYDK